MRYSSPDYLGFFPVACLIISINLSASCKKQNQGTSEIKDICVIQLSPKASDYKVAGADLDSIVALFKTNGLPTADLQFLSWSTDVTTNIYSTQYSGRQEQVLATRFINGLPVFADNEFFTFNADKFQPGGMYDGYTNPAPSGDSLGHQTLPNLRKAFLAHVPESHKEGAMFNGRPFVPSASTCINSCLNVTFGYLDASMVPGNESMPNKAQVKVWSVTPVNNSAIIYYPLIYVENDDGFAWGVPFSIP